MKQDLPVWLYRSVIGALSSITLFFVMQNYYISQAYRERQVATEMLVAVNSSKIEDHEKRILNIEGDNKAIFIRINRMMK